MERAKTPTTPCEGNVKWATTPQEIAWQRHFESALRLTSVLDTRKVMTIEKAKITLAQGRKWVLTKNEARRSNGLTVVALRDKNLGLTERDEIPQDGVIVPAQGRFFVEVSLWHTTHAGFTNEALLSVCPMVWKGQTRTDSNGEPYRILHHANDLAKVNEEVPLDCGCITDRIGYLGKVSLKEEPNVISQAIAKAMKEIYANGFQNIGKEIRQSITADTTAKREGRTRLDDVSHLPNGGLGWNGKPLKGNGPAWVF